MNTDTELKNHVLFEFKLNDPFPHTLNETRGVVNGINQVVSVFSRMVMQQMKETFSTGKETKVFYDDETDEFQYSDLKTFFNKFDLILTVCTGDKNSYSGGINIYDSIVRSNNTFVCEPNINLKITATSLTNAMNIFALSIGHELTHGYNFLQYAIKNGHYDPRKFMSDTKYDNFSYHMKHSIGNLKAMAQILYKLSRVERNAYLAQLKQELTVKKDELKDAKSVFNAIKETESYKTTFKNLEENLTILNSVHKPDVQKELVIYINDIMDKNFSNYNQFLKHINGRWNKWKKAYLIKASKIAYDIFAEKNIWLDGNDMSECRLIQS